MSIAQKGNEAHRGWWRTLSSLVVGLYAWITAVSFGAVVLDIAYSRLFPGAAAAFSRIADLLLLVTTVTVLAALGSIIISWTSYAARNLSVAGLIVMISGFFAFVLLSPVLGAGSPWGAVLRLVVNGFVSALALAAFYRLCRNE